MVCSQDYYAALLGDSGGFLATMDDQGIVSWVGPEVRAVLGRDPSELIGRFALDFLAPADVAAGRNAIAALLSNQARLQRTVLPVRHADGGYRVMEIVGRDLRLRPEIGRIVVQVRDVTGERQVVTELQESRSQLAEAYQIAGLGRWEWNVQTGEVRFSTELLRLLGWKKQPASRWSDLRQLFVHPDDLERVEEAVAAAKPAGPVSLEYRVVWPDGRIRQWLMHAQGSADLCGELWRVTGIVMDVTERRQAEAELFRAQKLEALDQLAAGIAHDFNNLLTVIQGNLSLAKAPLGPYEAGPLLAEAEAACERAAYLAHQLSSYARGREARAFEPTQLRPLLADVIPFLLRGSRVRSELLVPDDLRPVQGDAGALAQVLQNLVLNAIAAMPEGGVLRAEAANVALPEADPAAPLPPGAYVRLLVADSGHGVAPEHLPRIFDPYFTTRKGGQGLGLATTQRIVHHHGGHIAVQSRTGLGTMFVILLPAAAAEAATAEPRPAGRPPLALKCDLHVLLVDDEDLVRSAGAKMLKELGCRVDVAEGSEQALSLMRRAVTSGRPYQLAILDVTLPGDLGATELFARLWAIAPLLRGVVSSGYAHHDTMRDPVRHGFRAALPKPYGLGDLREALAAAALEDEQADRRR